MAKLDASGAIIFLSYLGGSSVAPENGFAVAVDRFDNPYFTGRTGSADFPYLNTLPNGRAGDSIHDVFLTRLDPQGRLLVSTTLDFPFGAEGLDIEVDRTGFVYLTGEEFSAQNGGGLAGGLAYGAFVVKLEAAVPTCVNRQDDLEDAIPADEICDVDLNMPGEQCTLLMELTTASSAGWIGKN